MIELKSTCPYCGDSITIEKGSMVELEQKDYRRLADWKRSHKDCKDLTEQAYLEAGVGSELTNG